MRKLEAVLVNVARKATELNVCDSVCTFVLYQPKVSVRLREKVRKGK